MSLFWIYPQVQNIQFIYHFNQQTANFILHTAHCMPLHTAHYIMCKLWTTHCTLHNVPAVNYTLHTQSHQTLYTQTDSQFWTSLDNDHWTLNTPQWTLTYINIPHLTPSNRRNPNSRFSPVLTIASTPSFMAWSAGGEQCIILHHIAMHCIALH